MDHAGYKTYYVGESTSSPTSTNTNDTYSDDDEYITESNTGDRFQYRTQKEPSYKHNPRSTIYDEDGYTLPRISSNYDHHIEVKFKKDETKADNDAKPSRNCIQNNPCYCFATVWLIVIVAGAIGTLFVLLQSGIIGQGLVTTVDPDKPTAESTTPMSGAILK